MFNRWQKVALMMNRICKPYAPRIIKKNPFLTVGISQKPSPVQHLPPMAAWCGDGEGAFKVQNTEFWTPLVSLAFINVYF